MDGNHEWLGQNYIITSLVLAIFYRVGKTYDNLLARI